MLRRTKIVLALDGLVPKKAVDIAREVGRFCHAVKIHHLYDDYGYEIVRELRTHSPLVWVDTKLLDTPKAAARRAAAIARNGARIITVHASGGSKMMRAVVEQLNSNPIAPPSVWGVGLLTSLDENDIANIYGADRTPGQIMLHFALAAKEAGLDGFVCSPREVGQLKMHPDLRRFTLVTPGIRRTGADKGDQSRVGTPKEAREAGADFFVVGSEVTEAEDPVAAFMHIASEIGEVNIHIDTQRGARTYHNALS